MSTQNFIEEKGRNLWSSALDDETERRYGMNKHHPPEDCPLWFTNEFRQSLEEAITEERKRIELKLLKVKAEKEGGGDEWYEAINLALSIINKK